MWFKNLRIYRLTEKLSYSPEELNDALEPFAFNPCGKLDPVKYGWAFPLGREGSQYVHAANGYIMICAKRQEKIIPSAVIKEALEEKVAEINTSESRHVSRSERESIKDEIIFTLLPKAFVKSAFDYAYIDTHDQLIVVDSSSAKRAEELLSALREALESLKVIPLTPLQSTPDVMTHWVRSGELPKDIELGEECEMRSPKEDRVIRCKHQDLGADEVHKHIESGLHVAKLAVIWKEAIECMVDEELSFKRIKYDNAIHEKADDSNADTKAEQFDIDFSIMTLEVSAFIRAMCKAFGGVETDASAF